MRRSFAEGLESLSQMPIGADAPCPVVAVANLPFRRAGTRQREARTAAENQLTADDEAFLRKLGRRYVVNPYDKADSYFRCNADVAIP